MFIDLSDLNSQIIENLSNDELLSIVDNEIADELGMLIDPYDDSIDRKISEMNTAINEYEKRKMIETLDGAEYGADTFMWSDERHNKVYRMAKSAKLIFSEIKKRGL